MKKIKCPLCSSTFEEKSFANQIDILKMSRSIKSLKSIEKLLIDMDNVRSVREVDIYYLLNEIKNIDDDILYRMIDMFRNRGYLEQGYNIKYFVKMVTNHDEQSSLKDTYEKKTLDRLPPKLEEQE
tara:strand:- start:8810 stop:9187 length:378 start_codon:yes stop_codon:yes gene_type:complete